MRTKKRRPLLIVLVTLVALVVVLLLVATGWVNSYVRSDSFRELVGDKSGRLFRAEGEFMPLRWSANGLFSDGFKAKGREDSTVHLLDASQIRADVTLGQIIRRDWHIDHISIGKARIDFKKPTKKPAQFGGGVSAGSTGPQWLRKWLPARVDVDKVRVHSADVVWLQDDLGGVFGTQLDVMPRQGSLNLEAERGYLQTAKLVPRLDIKNISARYRTSELHVTKSEFTVGDDGMLAITGMFGFAPHARSRLDVDFAGIPAEPLVPDYWDNHFTGRVGGDVTIEGNLKNPEGLALTGRIAVQEAELYDLPVLEQISRYTRTPGFKHLVLQTLEGHVEHEGARTKVEDFVLEAEGLIRIEGRFGIDGRVIEGDLKLGVTPRSLQWLLGARKQVFTEKRDGYLWTDVRISGTLDAPQEDLSRRLIAAFPAGVIEEAVGPVPKTVGGVIDTATGVIDRVTGSSGDDSGESGESGVVGRAAETTTDVVREVTTGVLDLLMPGATPEPVAPATKPQGNQAAPE